MSKLKYNPYSFSKISKFKQCPMAFKFRYILKKKMPITSYHLEKGDYIHLILEAVLKGEMSQFKRPTNYTIITLDMMKEYEGMALRFARGAVFTKVLALREEAERQGPKIVMHPPLWNAERGFAFGMDMKPCGADLWTALLRGKIDFSMRDEETNKAYIYDWKTGKLPHPDYPKDEDQLDLYALWFFRRYPELEEIDSVFAFVEHDAEQCKTYTRKDEDQIERTFLEYIREIEVELDFAPNESNLCHYCEFLSICPSYS